MRLDFEFAQSQCWRRFLPMIGIPLSPQTQKQNATFGLPLCFCVRRRGALRSAGAGQRPANSLLHPAGRARGIRRHRTYQGEFFRIVQLLPLRGSLAHLRCAFVVLIRFRLSQRLHPQMHQPMSECQTEPQSYQSPKMT